MAAIRALFTRDSLNGEVDSRAVVVIYFQDVDKDNLIFTFISVVTSLLENVLSSFGHDNLVYLKRSYLGVCFLEIDMKTYIIFFTCRDI